MKWIGQHIWNFISRFRNDVYLEDLTESAQDHVVGVDADGAAKAAATALLEGRKWRNAGQRSSRAARGSPFAPPPPAPRGCCPGGRGRAV